MSLLIAIHPSVGPEIVSEALRDLSAERAWDGKNLFLSHQARHLKAAVADSLGNPAFLYSPLEERHDALIVLRQARGVLPNAFSIAWIADLLLREEVNEVIFERRVGKGRPDPGRITPESLRQALPAECVDDPPGRWFRVIRGKGLAEAAGALRTTLPSLREAWTEFEILCARHSHRDTEQFENGESPAAALFMYSLFGANQKSYVLEALLGACGDKRRMIDMGGGHGFLGLEMAAKGWTVEVTDHDSTKCGVLGPWLRSRVGQTEQSVSFVQSAMEDGLHQGPAPTLITFFNSLYLMERAQAHPVVRQCFDSLAPGGILAVQEVLQDSSNPAARDYNLRFRYAELLDILGSTGARVEAVSMFDGTPRAVDPAEPSADLLLVRRNQ